MLFTKLRQFKSFTRLRLIFRPGGGSCGGQGSCSKGEHIHIPSDHDNYRCVDDKYNCDNDHIWQLSLWPWLSKTIILVMMKVNDKIFATVTRSWCQWQSMTIMGGPCWHCTERRGWWWSMTIIFATMTIHDQSITNQWQTQDWGGLVDIVLRGEAALLENKKSGEKHENKTSY